MKYLCNNVSVELKYYFEVNQAFTTDFAAVFSQGKVFLILVTVFQQWDEQQFLLDISWCDCIDSKHIGLVLDIPNRLTCELVLNFLQRPLIWLQDGFSNVGDRTNVFIKYKFNLSVFLGSQYGLWSISLIRNICLI